MGFRYYSLKLTAVLLAAAWLASPAPADDAIEPRTKAGEEKAAEEDRGGGFQWGPTLKQSLFFLGVQHAFRFTTEPGTRAELRGPFFKDYLLSLKGLHGWEDSDPMLVNYIGHPFMGAVTGYIQVQNDPGYRKARFGGSELYWKSRMRAFAYSAAYSTMFELGPVSEASLGNVGKDGLTMGYVDIVMTPVGGLTFMVIEDALDRYVIERIERATRNRYLKTLARTFLNPNRTFANTMRLKQPWYRDNRGGLWRQQ